MKKQKEIHLVKINNSRSPNLECRFKGFSLSLFNYVFILYERIEMSIVKYKFILFILQKFIKGGKNMPSIDVGRKKVLEYIEDNKISISDLAVAYGVKKQDLSAYLSGRLENVKGNQIILRIIADYRIR